jgi:hypothetical protein
MEDMLLPPPTEIRQAIRAGRWPDEDKDEDGVNHAISF